MEMISMCRVNGSSSPDLTESWHSPCNVLANCGLSTGLPGISDLRAQMEIHDFIG